MTTFLCSIGALSALTFGVWHEPDRVMRDPDLVYPSERYSQLMKEIGKPNKLPTIYTLQSKVPEQYGGQAAEHSIACIEFDEQGDFGDVRQLDRVEKFVRAKADAGGVLLVYFIPGWQSNAVCGDFVRFHWFLQHLSECISQKPGAQSEPGAKPWSVVGVYLAWRGTVLSPGSIVKPAVYEQPGWQDLQEDSRWLTTQWWLKGYQALGFWSRQSAASRFASGPLVETVTRLSRAARERDLSQVVLMGYSMGGNILERTLMQTVPGSLVESEEHRSAYIEPVADLVLLLNSAAPAAYMRRLQDFFSRYEAKTDTDGPWIVSVSSENDSATGVAFPLAQRIRHGVMLRKDNKELFLKTAGNVPAMRTHVVKLGDLTTTTTNSKDDWRFSAQLGIEPVATVSSPENRRALTKREFLAWDGPGFGKLHQQDVTGRICELVGTSSDGVARASRSPCWVVSVPEAIMADHGDIWSANSVNLMVALYRMSGLADRFKQQPITSSPARRIWLKGREAE